MANSYIIYCIISDSSLISDTIWVFFLFIVTVFRKNFLGFGTFILTNRFSFSLCFWDKISCCPEPTKHLDWLARGPRDPPVSTFPPWGYSHVPPCMGFLMRVWRLNPNPYAHKASFLQWLNLYTARFLFSFFSFFWGFRLRDLNSTLSRYH